VFPRFAGIALENDPAQCDIALDIEARLWPIARDQNGIALDQLIEL
jgi:hypothetical protein